MADLVFIDLKEQHEAEEARLKANKTELEIRERRDGGLPPDLEQRLDNIKEVLKLAKAKTSGQAILDPAFRRLREVLNSMFSTQPVDEHVGGKFGTVLEEKEKRLAGVYGLLAEDGIPLDYDPRLFDKIRHTAPPTLAAFDGSIPKALSEYTTHFPLFDAVLDVLKTNGSILNGGQLRTSEWVAVVRSLRDDSVRADDTMLPLKVRLALGKRAGGGDGAPTSADAIDLPDLEAQSDLVIVADNLYAVQALYFAAMLEEMRFFQAMDVALEQWQLGMLVVGRGKAGDKFYKYWRKQRDLFSEIERRSLAARVFGVPGGDAVQGALNREFKPLWLRFLSAVSSFSRQLQVDSLLRSNIPVAVSQEQVRQSGRDLAANLTLHGYGIAYFAAAELQQQIEEIIELLSDEEVKRAYGARDMFQVIEQIILFQGGEVGNTVQKRVSANAGSIIIRWLADHARLLSGTALEDIIDIQAIRSPMPRLPGTKPSTQPTDSDLVNAVEQWLAVNGVQDQTIEEQSQAQEPPRTPSRPIQIPSIGRELLESVGVSAGLGNGHGNGHGYTNGRQARH